MSTKIEISDYLRHVKALFPQFKMTEDLLDYWVRALKPFDKSTLYKATEDYIRSERYAPDLSSILTRCFRLQPLKSGRRREIPLENQPKEPEIQKGYAVIIGGKRFSKIEFAMDMLGPSKVSEILKNELKINTVNAKNAPGITQEKYFPVLDQLVGLAIQDFQNGIPPKFNSDLYPKIKNYPSLSIEVETL